MHCTSHSHLYYSWSLCHFSSRAHSYVFVANSLTPNQLHFIEGCIDSHRITKYASLILHYVVTLICKNKHLNHLLFLCCLPAPLFFNNFPRLFIFLLTEDKYVSFESSSLGTRTRETQLQFFLWISLVCIYSPFSLHHLNPIRCLREVDARNDESLKSVRATNIQCRWKSWKTDGWHSLLREECFHFGSLRVDT